MTLRNKGFTLLEVLIGMSLLSVMMLLLFSSLRICVTNWDAGEKKIAQVSQVAVVQKFFKQHLEGIRPLVDDFSTNEPQFSFQGEQNQLQFVASMPASAGRLGLQLFTVKQIQGSREAGKHITVTLAPFFPLFEGEEWNQEEVVIAKHVKNMEITYFGPDDGGDDPRWSDEWLDREKLPLLIKIVIKLMDDQVWPNIVVAPKINAKEKSRSQNPFETFNEKFSR